MSQPSLETTSSLVEQTELPLLGMHCSACANRIEKALGVAPGVESAVVNYATTRASVQYDPSLTSPAKLREVVQDAGYDALLPGQTESGASLTDAENEARASKFAALKSKFIIALCLTVPLAILAMGPHLFPALQPILGFPGSNWVQLALATPVLFWAGGEFFTGAWSATKHRAADMNTLVSIGTLAAYVFSVAATVAPGAFINHSSGVHHAPVYFEVAGMVVTLILMGRLLEARARAQTGSAIRALMELG
ncbi:cation-translocating P-type ATPase, partial [bacterium]